MITELLLAELDREAVGILKTLERVPEGKNDWKPHEIYCRSFPEHSFRLIPARQLALFFPQFLESPQTWHRSNRRLSTVPARRL
jgi:hypothetical protein